MEGQIHAGIPDHGKIPDHVRIPDQAQRMDALTVTDIDGNVYPIIKIGEQWWMAENLKVTHYNNEDPIPTGLNNNEWANTNEGAYSWYENDYDEYGAAYGALYNGYTVVTANLCPTGWRVPNDADCKKMEGYVDTEYNVGDEQWDYTGWRGFDAGLRLKSTSGWYSEGNGTDNYGFSALPGGYRSARFGNFVRIGVTGFWWSSSDERDYMGAWSRSMHWSFSSVLRQYNLKNEGYSVRCIRDVE